MGEARGEGSGNARRDSFSQARWCTCQAPTTRWSAWYLYVGRAQVGTQLVHTQVAAETDFSIRMYVHLEELFLVGSVSYGGSFLQFHARHVSFPRPLPNLRWITGLQSVVVCGQGSSSIVRDRAGIQYILQSTYYYSYRVLSAPLLRLSPR